MYVEEHEAIPNKNLYSPETLKALKNIIYFKITKKSANDNVINKLCLSVLISSGLVDDRTEKLASDIRRHYLNILQPGESIVALCILKGAYR